MMFSLKLDISVADTFLNIHWKTNYVLWLGKTYTVVLDKIIILIFIGKNKFKQKR